MGCIVDEHGYRPNPEKTKAVRDTPAPKNIHEIQSYFGMLQYYGRFLQNLSTVLEPLHRLCAKMLFGVGEVSSEMLLSEQNNFYVQQECWLILTVSCQYISFAMRLLMG